MENNITEIVTRLVFQLAVILVAAKLGGEACERYLKVPPVLGELVAGIIIGPFALGGLTLFGAGPLFPLPGNGEHSSAIPVSSELYAFAQVASVVLLFTVGLETNLQQFLRYVGPASLVALGGVVVPFALGVYGTILFGHAEGVLDPKALFMGAALTATSVGITARVLSDWHRLDTPEGVTILGAAVVDDVLGILVLTVVVGVAEGGAISVGHVALVGTKAIGFWLGLTGIGLLLAPYIARLLHAFWVPGAAIALALGLAFLAAGLAEGFGLAMIIGAYSMGLALSRTSLAEGLHEPMTGLYNALVPVFFVVMGMMVNVRAVEGALALGLVITIFAFVGKVVGCGVPALGVGFNLRGASRIGFGMLPRGEVALIIAGVGLARGVIQADLFGVTILMTVVTTLMAPPTLAALFRGGESGRRAARVAAGGAGGDAHPGSGGS